MTPTRRRRPALVAVLMTMSLAASACGGDEGDNRRAATGRSGAAAPEVTTSVVPTSEASVTTTTATTGARTDTTRRATNPPTAGAAPTAPGARAFTPARPGTYRYDTTGTSMVGASTPTPFPGVTTLVVDPPAGSRQHWRRDLRDPTGNGSVTELTADYRPDGVYLEELKAAATFGGFGDSRVLRASAPLLFLPTGAGPGHHLDLEMSVIGGKGGTAQVVVDLLREEPVSVGGSIVDALVAKVVVVLPPGDVTGRTELNLWLDRASGLLVRDGSVSDATAAGGLFKLHSEYQATLQRLTPY